MKIPSAARRILRRLNDSGYEAYLVGGCVRDALMHREMHDIDITTSALPEETKAVFSDCKVIETGIKHGTVTVIIEGETAEITTYRTESGYSDSRHPDSVSFTKNLRDDLSRRDFTMNAICADKDGNIVDIFGGEKDIENKTIRCIGDADERLNEDALRIFRAVRFSSVLGFEIEKNTSDALFRNMSKLQNIAVERLYTELLKALCGDNIKSVLLRYTDIFSQIIPELSPMKGFDQKNPHHIYDVMTHTAVAVESIPKKPLLRLSALMHDIGKPDTFFTDEKGIGHFYGHNIRSAEITYNVMKRLKASNSDTDYVTKLVKYHDVQIEPTEKAVRRFMAKHGADFLKDLVLLKRADNRAQNIAVYNYSEYYDRIYSIADEIISSGRCLSLNNLAVNGGDLMKKGIPRGKVLGEILTQLLTEVIEGNLPNEKEKLIEKALKIYKHKQKKPS